MRSGPMLKKVGGIKADLLVLIQYDVLQCSQCRSWFGIQGENYYIRRTK